MVAQFSKPSDGKAEGYDENGGSLWRVRIPIGMTRKVILTEGKGLRVESNNSTVVLNGKLNEVEINGGSMRVFSLFANGAGTSMLEAKDGSGKIQAFIQVAVKDDAVAIEPENPGQQLDYIDERLTAVGYGVYLGGVHVYCDNLTLPVFVPNAEINYTLTNAAAISKTVFADRASAFQAVAAVKTAAGGPTPFGYYRGVGGALIVPTVFSPATTPHIDQTIRTAMVVLANDVKNEMTVLAGTLAGLQVMKTLAARVIRWSQGKPNSIPGPPPKPQMDPAEERLLSTQQNLQGKAVVRSGQVLTAPMVVRHTLNRLNPMVAYGRIEKDGHLRISTGATAHYGDGVYVWRVGEQKVGAYIDVEIPAGTAVETLQVDGKSWYRLVPPTGDKLPIKIVGTNLTDTDKQMARIMTRD